MQRRLWTNSALISDDPAHAVRQLKTSGALSMRTIGRLTLCRSLLNAGLVDRFRVVIFPVMAGGTGRDRIYDDYPDVSLEMIDHHTFDGRFQVLAYRPTVIDSSPASRDWFIMIPAAVKLTQGRVATSAMVSSRPPEGQPPDGAGRLYRIPLRRPRSKDCVTAPFRR